MNKNRNGLKLLEKFRTNIAVREPRVELTLIWWPEPNDLTDFPSVKRTQHKE